jgi:AcrR family transcriptional regulator
VAPLHSPDTPSNEATPGSGAAPEALGGGSEVGALRGRIGQGRVGELQRARILAAMSELVRERGAIGVTVAHVVGRSGVSRRTFYELFEDREDCFLAAFDQAIARAGERVLPAYKASGVWQEQMRAGLGALLEFLEEEPDLGGLCVVDALAAGGAALERRTRIVDVLVDAVHEGGAPRRAAAGGRVAGAGRGSAVSRVASRPGRIVAEGVVGAVLAILHARLVQRPAGSLMGLLNPLMSIIVLPYLGSAAAVRERREPAARRRRAVKQVGDPLRGLDMRLTYRTVRVLFAVAELGGRGLSPSSRLVADASGISDQGQMSKLLWRLEHLGLIANAVENHGRGAPNAWVLTSKGREIERAIHAQTSPG